MGGSANKVNLLKYIAIRVNMVIMIEITPDIYLDASELRYEFVRSSGPGGQNVNKVATTVQLRFDAAGSPSLPEAVRDRLPRIAGKRMTTEGVLVIQASRFRSQELNRRDALNRLVELLRRACLTPKQRRRTRPSRASRERSLAAKLRRSRTKQLRRRVSRWEE